MPETDYLKIPQNRVGALIGSNGNVKKSIEKATGTMLDIDSDEGTVYITPRDDMEDPLGVWNANHIVKAVARGFNPEVALKLVSDDIYLEVISLPLYIGKSKKALARHKSVYGFLEHKKENLKMKEFKDLVGIEDDKIEFKDGIDFDEKDY